MTPPSHLPPTFPHPNAFDTLLPHLLPLLPSTIPLVRRIQFHLSSPHAKVLATFPPSHTPPATPLPFSACWVDRTRRPETECWIFSTYEISHNACTPQPHEAIPTPEAATARAQLLALLLAIAETPWLESVEEGEEELPLLIIGSVHASLLPLLAGNERLPASDGVISRLRPRGTKDGGTSVLGGVSGAYTKWIIPPSVSVSDSTAASKPEGTLPPGCSFSAIKREELGRVVASTKIPRSEATLAGLGGVCVRDAEGRVLSWGFLGVDGSLSSLFTEQGYRGRGLAKAVAGALVEGLGGEGEGSLGMRYRGIRDGEGWAHSDIDAGNKGSAAVARACGGRVGWECRWISVDLGKVKDVVSRLDVEGDQIASG
ncbi:hypothetical protein G7Y79_00045g081390 [Physcia stellaris]|nr:hypothetical protein G7Y79_00045g081390 [Physcia stellaris]